LLECITTLPPTARVSRALDHITRSDAKELQVAWSYQTGDTPVSISGGDTED